MATVADKFHTYCLSLECILIINIRYVKDVNVEEENPYFIVTNFTALRMKTKR